MYLIFRHYLALSFIFFIVLINHSITKADDFNKNLNEVRAEINRDNLQDAIKKLKKVEINSTLEQDQIDLLFGDIYLKINKPQKAEEFYQKVHPMKKLKP